MITTKSTTKRVSGVYTPSEKQAYAGRKMAGGSWVEEFPEGAEYYIWACGHYGDHNTVTGKDYQNKILVLCVTGIADPAPFEADGSFNPSKCLLYSASRLHNVPRGWRMLDDGEEFTNKEAGVNYDNMPTQLEVLKLQGSDKVYTDPAHNLPLGKDREAFDASLTGILGKALRASSVHAAMDEITGMEYINQYIEDNGIEKEGHKCLHVRVTRTDSFYVTAFRGKLNDRATRLGYLTIVK